MKLSPKLHILLTALVLILTIALSQPAMSQPPPPPPGGGHGLGGNQGSGSQSGAPIGGGMGIFVLLGALYAGRKSYKVLLPFALNDSKE